MPGRESLDFETSTLEVRETILAGRGIFSNSQIPAGTLLLKSADLTTHTVNREYRREVCSQCFAYDRGSHWKIRDASVGATWCTEDCKRAWSEAHHQLVVREALGAVERLISHAKGHKGRDMDVTMLESCATPPTAGEIARAWEEVGQTADCICSTRRGNDSKPARRAVQMALAEPPTPLVLTFLLSAVLAASFDADLWKSMLTLQAANAPYPSFAILAQHTSAYLQLLCVLPIELLQFCTPDLLLCAANRDTHNSFGLRSLDDEGAEMFGYGVWPSASFWNHSCDPNVSKFRSGRTWHFSTSRDVEGGEELCISYLGGDETSLNVHDRKQRLRETWAFECLCLKCVSES